jgi:hypothetical protein
MIPCMRGKTGTHIHKTSVIKPYEKRQLKKSTPEVS